MAERVREELLLHHQGRANGITGKALAARLEAGEREVRAAVTELRKAGQAVCGHPSSGYFQARTPEELEETCAFLRARALHSLVLESRLRKMPLATLVEELGDAAPQLRMQFNEEA